MKCDNQFVLMTAKEMSVANGGIGISMIPGLTFTGTGTSSVDYTGYVTAVGAAYAAMSAGHAAFMGTNGAGMAMFLANLRFPTS